MSPSNPYPSTSTERGEQNVGGSQQSVGQRLNDAASQAKNKATELGHTAMDKIEQGRQAAAGSLSGAASSVRSGLHNTSTAIDRAGERTASTLENTAAYMRDHDVRGMMRDAEDAIKRNPGPALLAAAAFGFLLGSAMRRQS
jgi:ElaB/YqjD/DUF883 family membrane-anchored ribosome-binding protein